MPTTPPIRDFTQIPNNWKNFTVPAASAAETFEPPIVAIEVGTAGNVDAETVTGTRAVFKCPAGKRLVGYFAKIYGSSTTTATDIVIGW